MFQELFQQNSKFYYSFNNSSIVEECNKFIAAKDNISGLTTEQLLNAQANLIDDRPSSFDECIVWARLKFQELFYNK